MEKRYAYRYNGSALAAARPLEEKRILDLMGASQYPEKFEVYELVPVERLTKMKLTPVYELARKKG